VNLLVSTWKGWRSHDGDQLAAAFAYYGAFTIVPLSAFVLGVAGRITGAERAQQVFVDALSQVAGEQSAQLIAAAVASYARASSASSLLVVSAAIALYAAVGLFRRVSRGLHLIWGAPPAGTLRGQLSIYGLALAVIGVLCVGLVAAVTLLGLSSTLKIGLGYRLLSAFGSLALLTAAFTAAYRYLSGMRPPWRAALVGAIPAALVYALGTVLLGIYIGQSVTISAWGAAGSLLGVLVWLYFSAYVFLLGAQLGNTYREFREAPTASVG
jgi:membrane protein